VKFDFGQFWVMRNGSDGKCGSPGNEASITYRLEERLKGSNPTLTARSWRHRLRGQPLTVFGQLTKRGRSIELEPPVSILLPACFDSLSGPSRVEKYSG